MHLRGRVTFEVAFKVQRIPSSSVPVRVLCPDVVVERNDGPRHAASTNIDFHPQRMPKVMVKVHYITARIPGHLQGYEAQSYELGSRLYCYSTYIVIT